MPTACTALTTSRSCGSAPALQVDVKPTEPEMRVDYAMMIYQGVPVAFTQDIGEVCITDIWRAAGSPGLTPAEWLRSDDGKGIVLAYSRANNMGLTHIISTAKGRGDYGAGTWVPREVALAYAQKLDYDLWLACNRFILNRSKQFTTSATPGLSPQALAVVQKLVDQNNQILTSLGMLTLRAQFAVPVQYLQGVSGRT